MKDAVCGVCKYPLTATYYDLLGVPSDSSLKTIKRQYRQLVQIWHPDKKPTPSYAVEFFKALTKAYKTLSDPDKRRGYDESLGLVPNRVKLEGSPAHTDEESEFARTDYGRTSDSVEPTSSVDSDGAFVLHAFFRVSPVIGAFLLFILWVETNPYEFPWHGALLIMALVLALYGLVRTAMFFVSHWQDSG